MHAKTKRQKQRAYCRLGACENNISSISISQLNPVLISIVA